MANIALLLLCWSGVWWCSVVRSVGGRSGRWRHPKCKKAAGGCPGGFGVSSPEGVYEIRENRRGRGFGSVFTPRNGMTNHEPRAMAYEHAWA
jgi:hypothetical protein